jgi:hypothetical protein
VRRPLFLRVASFGRPAVVAVEPPLEAFDGDAKCFKGPVLGDDGFAELFDLVFQLHKRRFESNEPIFGSIAGLHAGFLENGPFS